MKLYRFVDDWDGSADLEEFEVIRETPNGYRIKDPMALYGNRWVSATGFKRFAYVSKKDAADSYVARKNRQIRILGARLDTARDNLKFFEENRAALLAEKPVLLLTDNHKCVDDGGFLVGSCKVCHKPIWP